MGWMGGRRGEERGRQFRAERFVGARVREEIHTGVDVGER